VTTTCVPEAWGQPTSRGLPRNIATKQGEKGGISSALLRANDPLVGLRMNPTYVLDVRKSAHTDAQEHTGLTSWFFWRCSLSSFGQAKILSQRYKSLPDKEKKKWEKKAEKDKKRYQEEMKNYEPPDDEEPTGKRSKKQKKDPNKPKRNMSAYFLYSVSIRPEVRKEHPDASFGQIAKIISQKFKDLSDKERQPWVQKANEDKKRYEREMREYNS